MVTLDAVRDVAAIHRYPHEALSGCKTALVPFAAAFHGRQDAVWIADAGLRATCVDVDHEKLGAMVLAYPEGWEYVHGDAFAYAEATGRRWDVVSVDPFTAMFDRCAKALPLWCRLARKAVVLGTGAATEVAAPDGWAVVEVLQRSSFKGGVFWTVLKRC